MRKLFYAQIEVPTNQVGCQGSYISPLGNMPERYLEWLEKVNIGNLAERQVDFAAHHPVFLELIHYREELEGRLNEHIPGHMITIGSCVDGSKVGNINEVDSLYVIHKDTLDVRATDKPLLYTICTENRKIDPRVFLDTFGDILDVIVVDIDAPSGLEHGGYAAPHYSGVRHNGPALTLQFRECLDGRPQKTLDITPVFAFSSQEIMRGVEHHALPMMQSIRLGAVQPGRLYLVPDLAENAWKVTTANIESSILRDVPSLAPVKKTISYTKIILSDLDRFNLETAVVAHAGPNHAGTESRLLNEISNYQFLEDGKETDVKRRNLNKLMRFGHLFMRPWTKIALNESTKPEVTVNTAAVKHMALRYGSQTERLPDAFSEAGFDNTAYELMRAIFEELSNEDSSSTDHALLESLTIPKYSVLRHTSQRHLTLATARYQCRHLLEKVGAED